MPQGLPVTPELVRRALIDGAALALILIVVAHLLPWLRMQILFGVLFLAAVVYVWLASRAQAGPGWLFVESLGVIVYSIMGSFGVRGSPWWLAAGWALHPLWDVLHWLGPGRSFLRTQRYPILCISFDLLVAGYIALLASRRPKRVADPAPPATNR